MTGKVLNAQGNGSVPLKYGTFYKYEITIDVDGKEYTGEYLSKSDDQNKFLVGETVEFTYQDGEYPKIKPVTNFEQSGGQPTAAPTSSKMSKEEWAAKDNRKELMIAKQVSIKAAVDFVVSHGGDEIKVLDIADMFTNWLLKGEKPAKDTNTDLPF